MARGRSKTLAEVRFGSLTTRRYAARSSPQIDHRHDEQQNAGMAYPVSSLVINPSAQSQRDFAETALPLIQGVNRVVAEVSDEGLVVRAVTETDLELAVWEIRRAYTNARQGKPQVAYDMGPPLMEPFYRASVDTPDIYVGAVIGDLSQRRATVQTINELPSGKQIIASIPVSECFGYSTVLRRLTGGKGKVSFEFSHYDRPPGFDVHPDP